jgi:hypothetical protein
MIFLSYSHANKEVIAPIAEALRRVFGQENVFFDQWAIQPGDSIIGKIDEGLSRCRFFFFFVSGAALTSKMVALEWHNALIKSVRDDAKVIPVKIDDCLMPAILLQNLYINLYGNGLEFSIRQMIEVASGKNTYKPGELSGYQNVRAYISGTERKIKIEFRAEAYTEPHSKYLILHENAQDELECSAPSTGMFLMGFQENLLLNNGSKFNGFTISRSEATSPRFPFIVDLSAKTEKPIKFVGAMKADSDESFVLIPSIRLPS